MNARYVLQLLVLGVILFNPSGVYASDKLPTRKAGLWEISTADAKGMPQLVKQCTDSSTDSQMMNLGEQMGSKMGIQCAKNELRKEGAGYVNESECAMGTMKIATKTVFSGDFNVAYTADTTVSYDPPMMGMKGKSTKATARWVGPCEAGQKPGDIVMPNGKRMNMNSLPSLVGKLPKNIPQNIPPR